MEGFQPPTSSFVASCGMQFRHMSIGQDRSFYGLFFDLSPAPGALCLHTSAFPSLYMHLQRVPPLSCFRSYYPLLLQRPVRFVNVQSDPYLGYILERYTGIPPVHAFAVEGRYAPVTTPIPQLFFHIYVSQEGLEPSCLTALDPKSRASCQFRHQD